MTNVITRRTLAVLSAVAFSAGACAPSSNEPPATAQATPVAQGLGVRPNGDTELSPDLTKVKSEELKKIYAHIDEHIDEHVVNLQKWIQQPSISNSGEGIPESAEMVKGFFEELGCQESRVYDVGLTEYGTQGNPVVYAKCDEGQPRTVLMYWMYDTMPVTQPDVWVAPPFEGRLVEQAPFKKVLIGRGATNSKGPQMAQLNTLRAIKAVAGKLPVNLIVIAEGDEERMSIGLRQFVKTHPELFKDAEVLWNDGGQAPSGRSGVSTGDSEGCVYIELTTSGAKWGRGPTVSDIHGGNKRSVDSPAWRHMKMLASLITDDGNRIKVDGFYDDAVMPTKEQWASWKRAGEVHRHEDGGREPRRGAVHGGRSGAAAPRPELDLVQHGRHLGWKYVCRRRRRDPAEQDYVEAQHQVRPEHDGARPRRENQETAGQERLRRR